MCLYVKTSPGHTALGYRCTMHSFTRVSIFYAFHDVGEAGSLRLYLFSSGEKEMADLLTSVTPLSKVGGFATLQGAVTRHVVAGTAFGAVTAGMTAVLAVFTQGAFCHNGKENALRNYRYIDNPIKIDM